MIFREFVHFEPVKHGSSLAREYRIFFLEEAALVRAYYWNEEVYPKEERPPFALLRKPSRAAF
ncbi:hypothetical protein [Thermosporothrix hazakensis]|uniref:hypothetical protein n=1 Tax=Thermosporothrix hazakensis TaxID=644383 RepID=UPI000DAE1D9D|nr:hypothetical protein [Thermosporothrix hazakensis]GCE47885.1 hypothetical protein KTH_27540 [Thermosporothrix hazakensis]